MNRWDGTNGTNAMIGTTNGTSGWKWRNRIDGQRTSKKLINNNEINGNGN